MKVGLVHFMAYPETITGEGPILKTLEEIAEDDFFSALEATHIKNPKVRKKAEELLQATGLDVYENEPMISSILCPDLSPDTFWILGGCTLSATVLGTTVR